MRPSRLNRRPARRWRGRCRSTRWTPSPSPTLSTSSAATSSQGLAAG